VSEEKTKPIPVKDIFEHPYLKKLGNKIIIIGKKNKHEHIKESEDVKRK